MKKNILTTQIIAGKYKGKKIELPSLDVTRSSKARLKESFFNVLQFDIIDKVFIEAFAGSGSIGLEAISRDAKKSYFIELNKSSYNVLVKNCKAIDINKCQTFMGDTFVQLPLILDSLKNSKDELIVYIDPPFDFRDGMEEIYENSFELVRNITNDNIFVICFEHLSTIEVPEILGKYEKYKSKQFGKSSLTYFRLKQI